MIKKTIIDCKTSFARVVKVGWQPAWRAWEEDPGLRQDADR